MPAQTVPLTSAPNQTFTATLNIDKGTVTLRLTASYKEICGHWMLTIADKSGTVILDSIPMITGSYPSGNILQQYAYLGIGSACLVNVSGISQDYPGGNSLGTDFKLIWDDTPAF